MVSFRGTGVSYRSWFPTYTKGGESFLMPQTLSIYRITRKLMASEEKGSLDTGLARRSNQPLRQSKSIEHVIVRKTLTLRTDIQNVVPTTSTLWWCLEHVSVSVVSKRGWPWAPCTTEHEAWAWIRGNGLQVKAMPLSNLPLKSEHSINDQRKSGPDTQGWSHQH